MSLFENFPYTNIHDLNLDWVLSTVRKLISEWTAYKQAMDGNFSDLKDDFDELQAYVEDYFTNLDVEQAVIDSARDILNEMYANGEFEKLIAGFLDKIRGGGEITVNLLAEYLTNLEQQAGTWGGATEFEHAPQGMTWIGRNRLVFFVRVKPEEANTGRLICLDLESGSILWTSGAPKKWYHGNTLAYKDGYIYLSAGLEKYITESGSTASRTIRKVFKIDIDNPTSLGTEINIATGVNIAIDDVTGKFYTLGTANGEDAGFVYEYTEDFGAQVREIALEQNAVTSRLFTAGFQGACVHDGIAYIQYYMDVNVIAAYDLTTGKLLQLWNVPYIWNFCKYSQEQEDITYDPIEDRFLIMSASMTQRLHNAPVANFAEIGLYKPVVVETPRYIQNDGTNSVIDIHVDTGSSLQGVSGVCLPFYKRFYDGAPNIPVFYSAYDAELYASLRGVNGFIRYVVHDHVTNMPVFSSWRPHTNFSIMQQAASASGHAQNHLRIVTPIFTRQTLAMVKGTAENHIRIAGSAPGGSYNGVVNASFLTHIYLSYVDIEATTDSTQYAIDVLDNGQLTLLNDVQALGGLTLYRVRTGGVIHNCRKLYDGAMTAGTSVDLSNASTMTGLIVIDFKVMSTDGEYKTIMMDRASGGRHKFIVPADGGYMRMIFSMSGTWAQLVSAVAVTDGTGTTEVISRFEEVHIRQYPDNPLI